MIFALIAAAHVYVLPWKMLFMLPTNSEKPCGITSVRYGPPDGSWEGGSNPQPSDCQFHVSVHPGPLFPAWAELPPKPAQTLDVTYTVQGAGKPQTVDVKPEKVEPSPARAADFAVKAEKVKNRVRVEVTNKSDKPLLLGDATALRGKPKDACLGPGPAAMVAPGETLVDIRPGLLSPSMNVWIAVFTAEKECRWVEVARK